MQVMNLLHTNYTVSVNTTLPFVHKPCKICAEVHWN